MGEGRGEALRYGGVLLLTCAWNCGGFALLFLGKFGRHGWMGWSEDKFTKFAFPSCVYDKIVH
jgi:hypothetical protein